MPDQLRTAILNRLSRGGGRFGQMHLVDQIREQHPWTQSEVWAELWGLLGDRLVYIDPAGQGSSRSWDNWEWRLTDDGRRAIAEGSWEPRDVEGFLTRLRTHTPPLDSVVIRFVEEALRAFNSLCYLATSVMLGAASERAVIQLASSVARAAGTRAKSLTESLESPRTTQFYRFTAMRKVLEMMRPELPEGAADTLTMDAVGELLRLARNDAGHPTGVFVDEATAYTHLQIGGRYLLKMAELSAYLDAHSDAAVASDSGTPNDTDTAGPEPAQAVDPPPG